MDNVTRLKRQRPWLFIASGVVIAAAMGALRLTPVGEPLPIGLYITYWLVTFTLSGGVIQLAYAQAISNATRLHYLEEMSLSPDGEERSAEQTLARLGEVVKSLDGLDLIAYQLYHEGDDGGLVLAAHVELSTGHKAATEALMKEDAGEARREGLAMLHHRKDLGPQQQEVLDHLESDAFVIVPLLWAGDLRGMVCLAGRERLRMSRSHRRYLAALGERAASFLAAGAFASQRDEFARETGDYREIASAISMTQDLHEALEVLLEGVGESTFDGQTDGVGAVLFHPESRAVHAAAGKGLLASWSGGEQPIENPVSEKALFEKGEAVRVNVIENASIETPVHRRVAASLGICNVLAVPLKLQGRVQGAIVVARASSECPFTHSDEKRLASLAEHVAAAVENAQVYAMNRERISKLDRMASFKSNLVYNISHELRTSLSSLKAATDMLLDEKGVEPGSEYYDRLLQSVSRNVARQETLVSNIVDMASIENASLTLNMEKIDVGSLIAETTSLVAPLMNQRGQVLSVSAAPDSPSPMADRVRLSQVLVNLLTNAQKYAPEGSEISLSVERRGDRIVFVVSDAGVGIPIEERERVFEAFYRVNDESNVGIPGSGLGLSIARSLVELHRGSIWIEDGPKGGAEFIVSLPIEGVNESSDN